MTSADKTQHRHARRARRRHARHAVLHHEAGRRREAETLRGSEIDVRCGFRIGHRIGAKKPIAEELHETRARQHAFHIWPETIARAGLGERHLGQRGLDSCNCRRLHRRRFHRPADCLDIASAEALVQLRRRALQHLFDAQAQQRQHHRFDIGIRPARFEFVHQHARRHGFAVDQHAVAIADQRELASIRACGHLTAPNVRPRTSCFCDSQPTIRIGATASSDAAESFAQNKPSGLEYDAMNTVSGAAFELDRLMLQNASFHDRITSSSAVEASPGSDIGISR
ncbi:hypothetical protein KCU90_g1504, partial [Aureobasidium melanogenum]